MATTRSNTDKTKNLAAIPVSPSPDSHTTQLTLEDFRKGMNEFETNIYKKLERENSETKKSLEFISSKYDDLIKNIEMVLTNNKKLEDKMSVLQEENVNLRQEIESLRDAQDEMEQRSRGCNIDIHGIPEVKGENLMTLLDKMGSTVNVPLPSSSIVSVHRVARGHSSPSNRPRNIVVQLSTKRLRDDVIAAVRTRRGLTTEQLGLGVPATNFYVNEHLTLKNKILFAKTRAAGKANGYKYIWVRNGSIMAKKDDLSRVVTIRREGDLQKM